MSNRPQTSSKLEESRFESNTSPEIKQIRDLLEFEKKRLAEIERLSHEKKTNSKAGELQGDTLYMEC